MYCVPSRIVIRIAVVPSTLTDRKQKKSALAKAQERTAVNIRARDIRLLLVASVCETKAWGMLSDISQKSKQHEVSERERKSFFCLQVVNTKVIYKPKIQVFDKQNKCFYMQNSLNFFSQLLCWNSLQSSVSCSICLNQGFQNFLYIQCLKTKQMQWCVDKIKLSASNFISI